MNRVAATWLALVLCGGAPVHGAQSTRAAVDTSVPSCLTPEQIETNKQLMALTRPVKKEDPEWIFNPDYFLGTWTFEWSVPESPLGPSAELSGTLTFKHVDGCYYEGEWQAKGSDVPIKQRIQLLADPGNRWMTWIETDSRGFTLIKSGRMGGDLGGYFTHYWEVPVFTYKGKKIRLKGNHFLASPTSLRYRMQISVDGGPYTNFGNPWFTKDPASGPPPSRSR